MIRLARLRLLAPLVASAIVAAALVAPRSGAAQSAGAKGAAGKSAAATSAAAKPPFVVVVNAASPVSTVTRDHLSKIFYKKISRWPNGGPVQPVDQAPTSPTRAAFSKAVLGKNLPAVQAYWQQQIFSGREVPPPQQRSDSEVLAYIRANPQAVGYVADGTALGPGLKTVPILD